MPRARAARSAGVPPFGPLAGVRVLDSGRFVAAPWAATLLAQFGAEVVHVETPPYHRPYADPTRTLVPELPVGAPPERRVSESWVQYSRNKLSVGLDLATAAGRRLFVELAKRSEIWIESSRPGTYARLGLSDAVLLRAQPRLTIVHVSGYGQTGLPSRVRAPSYDLNAQAFSGLLALQGEPDPAPPARAGTALVDSLTGLAAANAALMGYLSARRTGRGQSIDVAQYEVAFSLLENLAIDFFARGVVRGRHGRAHPRLFPYDLYRARDGWVVVAAPNREAFHRLRTLLGWADARYDDPAYRLAHRAPLDARIARFCRARTLAELERLGRRHDLAIDRVRDIASIARDPHYRRRRMLPSWRDPIAGPVRGAGIVPKFSRTPGRIWRGAPWLGQDNERVFVKALGHSRREMRAWLRDGVVGTDPPPGRPARSAKVGSR